MGGWGHPPSYCMGAEISTFLQIPGKKRLIDSHVIPPPLNRNNGLLGVFSPFEK